MRSDPLATLRDIHLPPPIPAWPPALGGLIFLGLCVILLLGGGLYAMRRYQTRYPLREADKLLTRITTTYLQDGCLSVACADINMLLKRVCLMYYPREQVASLHGEAWISFLQETSHGLAFEPLANYLLLYPYQTHTDITPLADRETTLLPFTRVVMAWIKQQRRHA